MATSECQAEGQGPWGRVRGSLSRRDSRLLRQARLGSALVLRGVLLAMRGDPVPAGDPALQRRRWEETALASEAFREATTVQPGSAASSRAPSSRGQERVP